MRLRRRKQIVLVHPAGGEVRIVLPIDAELAGTTIETLGRLGYTIPAAEGRTKMRLDLGPQGIVTIPLPVAAVREK